MFTVDTLYSGTNFTFAANNIFWTQDVLDYYATNDTVSKVDIYSDLILQSIGDPAGTFFEEVLTLANVPVSLLQYVQDLYANPAAEDMFDFVVEDVLVQGGPTDSGNLFDFSMFDPCYDETSQSATAGTDGTAIGAVLACSMLNSVDVYEHHFNSTLNLGIYPNPMNQHATITYNLINTGEVRLSIHDMLGQEVSVLVEQTQFAGEHRSSSKWSILYQEGLFSALTN